VLGLGMGCTSDAGDGGVFAGHDGVELRGFLIQGGCDCEEGDCHGVDCEEVGSVRMAGDINGDGFADVLGVDVDQEDDYTAPVVAQIAVVFGKADGDTVELADVAEGRKGFVVRGMIGYTPVPYTSLAWDADGLGDFNGDGFDDFAFAGFSDDAPVYVVLGSETPEPLDLEDLEAGTGGFLLGQEAEDVGSSVAGPGDLNGDGLGEIVMTTSYDGAPSRTYVIFGTEGTPPTLAEVRAGTGGFVIEGASGWLDAAGDVNGDGVPDLKVGHGRVVFGKADTEPIQAADLQAGDGGFVIHAPEWDEWIFFGASAPAGDVNGDGFDDLLIDLYDYAAESTFPFGRTYVVYGKDDTEEVLLEDVEAGDGGYFLDWPSGTSVASGVGDQNGDGLADIAVTTWLNARVLFGKTDPGAAGPSDYRITGMDFGGRVAGGQDVSGDALPDLVIPAYPACAVVVFGGNLEP
jgi:hypothetical protein